ncbi:MAG: SAM-dependent methyltransferase [Actinomycetota bacterium]
MLIAILHLIGDDEHPGAIVRQLMDAVPPGSYLAMSHVASDIDPQPTDEVGRRLNQRMAHQVTYRGHADVCRFFDGLDLLEPGVVPVQKWRPDTEAESTSPSAMWGGVARKD